MSSETHAEGLRSRCQPLSPTSPEFATVCGGGAVSEFATQLPADGATLSSTPSAASAASLPSYEILGELGRGGMGVVYKARQTKLGRTVALKMILAGGHAGPAELERFRTEAEAIARLHHPNIVQIYEVGEQHGLPYFSLEFCAGGSLAQKLAGTPLPPKEAAALVEQLAQAMQAAHEAGVIHRDLKPANILLASVVRGPWSVVKDKPGLSRTTDYTPKITDFGLAKKLDEAGKTATGAVMGTPSYMAPEQASGNTRDIGPACDIYALGAILYECLTGRPPFRAATSLDTMMQVMRQEPVPPTQLNARVPRDLETICLKCLHKDPAHRYRTAQALADDVARFRAGEPIHARPPSLVQVAWLWSQRHRALLASALATVLVLTLAAAALAWCSFRAYRNVEMIRQREQPLRDLGGHIALYDEILTSATLLAAATGDSAFEQRYRKHEARLEQAIAQALELDPDAQPTVVAIDEVNRKLLRIEDHVFALVRAGKLKDAQSVIHGEEYLRFKHEYAARLARLMEELDERAERMLATADREARGFTTLAIALLILVMFVLAGTTWALVRTLRGD